MTKGKRTGILILGLMALSPLSFGHGLSSQTQLPIAPNEIALGKFRQYPLPQTQDALGAMVLYTNPASTIAGGSANLSANNLAMSLQEGVANRYISDNRSLSMVSGSPTNLDFTARLTRTTVQVYASFATTTVDYNSAAQRFVEFTAPGTVLLLVPEPSTWVMTIVGGGLLLSVQRFRKKKS